MANNSTKTALSRAIEKSGGQAALARAIGVTQPTIHDWLHRKGRVPGDWVPKVESASGIPRHELRPDLWQKVDGQQS